MSNRTNSAELCGDVAISLQDGATGSRPVGTNDVVPIDRAYLARFTFGDHDLEREILNLFLVQLAEVVPALAAAQTKLAWQTAAHTLKGSARAVGAQRVADCAQRAEAAFSNPASRAAELAHLERAAADVTNYIRRVFPDC